MNAKAIASTLCALVFGLIGYAEAGKGGLVLGVILGLFAPEVSVFAAGIFRELLVYLLPISMLIAIAWFIISNWGK